MVLILPEVQSEPFGPKGAAAAGLVAAIRAAVLAECGEEAEAVTVRLLGTYIILEGLVPNEDAVWRIRAIAEEIAGAGSVQARLFRQ